MTETRIRGELAVGAELHDGAAHTEGTGSRRDDARRKRSSRRRPSEFGAHVDRSAASKRSTRDAGLERFMDVLDRERLAPVDVLLLLRVAASEATVVELAAALDREPIAMRRAAGGLIGRGLLRQRWARRGLVLETMPSGLLALSRLAQSLDLTLRPES
jgi:hypothetical protein